MHTFIIKCLLVRQKQKKTENENSVLIKTSRRFRLRDGFAVCWHHQTNLREQFGHQKLGYIIYKSIGNR